MLDRTFRKNLLLWTSAVCAASAAFADTGPLTEVPGDPARGLAILRDGSLPSCLICHQISSLPDRDQGQLGPTLDGVAGRFTADELRLRIIDARKISPETIMPAYYATDGLFRVGRNWAGKTIYDPQQVEDVTAYLMTLAD